MRKEIEKHFRERYNEQPLIVRSPGRINIIGEHTDYNQGWVLPAAIDKAVYVAVSARTDGRYSLHSVGFHETIEGELADIRPTQNWSTYLLGVVDQLLQKGYPVRGFNLVVDGDIPIGAGLSSSAAVECAAIFALNELFQFGIPKLELVRMAQQAEHQFAGVKCGIMDMFASMMGQKDRVIRLDCRSLEYQYEPLPLTGYSLILFNTNVKHSLASSAYNERRQQCEQGVYWVQQSIPAAMSLRDISIEQLKQYVLPKDALVYQRCRFVVEEIQRLADACVDLEQGNLSALGKKLLATHDGLSNDYAVSCPELDFLVNAVRNDNRVLGGRMMGGGFGGCTINLVESSYVNELTEKLSRTYRDAWQLELTPYKVRIEDGTAVMSSETTIPA